MCPWLLRGALLLLFHHSQLAEALAGAVEVHLCGQLLTDWLWLLPVVLLFFILLLSGNLLKPQLARGELRCIGATTLDEYRKYIEKDPALERRFQQVRYFLKK